MDRVLVVLVGGLQTKYIGEGVKPWKPSSWQRVPASILPEEFARPKDKRTVDDIERAVSEQLPHEVGNKDYHFLPVSFNERFSIGVFSRRSPEDLAKDINHQINHKYQSLCEPGVSLSIVLLTFSAGALLTRRAMVMGLHEEPLTSGYVPWPHMVKTFIVLSGITKGWQFTTATPAPLRFFGQAVRFLAPFDLLIWKLYRGSPFVTDTRLAFHDAFSFDKRTKKEDSAVGWGPPRTIFFLGSKDEFVTPSDCIELDPSLDLVYIEIPHATHVEMLDAAGRSGDLVPKIIAEAITTSFDDKQMPEYSKDWISHAAAVSDIDDYLDPLDLKDDQRPDIYVDHVVIVMHGIRDDGFWAKRISREIKTLYRAHHSVDQARRLRTVTPSYGFFSMWDFLFPGGRTKALYWFLDKYADIRRLYPCATKIDLVAHSNGTYLGAQALRECKNVCFRRMLFAGSVVRRDFWMEPIDKLSEKLESFHSFIGREDFVVALLPGAMETIPFLGKLLNVGGAGAFGFIRLPYLGKERTQSLPESSCMNRLGFGAPQKQICGKELCTATQRMIKGGHGAAIQEDGWKTIASFIVEMSASMEETLDRQDKNDPTHALRRVSRGRASTLMLAVARVCIGIAIIPCLLFLLLFPAWYPFLILAGLVPAVSMPLLGPFPLMIPALVYFVLVVFVWVLYNVLRYL